MKLWKRVDVLDWGTFFASIHSLVILNVYKRYNPRSIGRESGLVTKPEKLWKEQKYLS